MRSRADARTKRSCFWIFVPVLLVLASGCTDGDSPSDLRLGDSRALLSLSPELIASLATVDAPEVVRVRVVATLFGDPEPIGATEENVNPGATSWPVSVAVTIPPGEEPVIELTVELLSASGAVEWSGHVGPLTLTPGQTTKVESVTIVRGPLVNLSVTAVSVTGPARLRVGESATLQSEANSSQPGVSPVIYLSSLDPEVGTVSEGGLFQALTPGTARVVAVAGAVSDTISIQVLPALAAVVVSPSEATADALGVELTFSAQVLDTNEDPAEGETVTWAVDNPQILENLGGGAFRAVGVGTATVTASSDSKPALSGAAGILVRQLPARVEVTSSSATLTAVGETAQFSAEAFDANDNGIPGAVFGWSSSSTGVATVNANGLVTASGDGTAEIRAEALGPDQRTPTGIYGTAQVTVELPITVFIFPETAEIAAGAAVEVFARAEDETGSSPAGITFSWSTSNPEIASVQPAVGGNGHRAMVRGVSPGEATITVTAEGLSASAVVTVTQGVVALRWVQEPPASYTYNTMEPAPVVEAIDGNGNRVESFQGTIGLVATWLGYEFTPPGTSPPEEGPGGPELNVDGDTTVEAVAGLAVFSNIFMTLDGFYTLTAYATSPQGVPLSAESQIFQVYYYIP